MDDLGTLITAMAAVVYGPILVVIIICVVIVVVGFTSYTVREQLALRKYGVKKLRDNRYISAKSYTFTFQQLAQVGSLDAKFAENEGNMTFYKFGTQIDSVGVCTSDPNFVIVITEGQANPLSSFNPKIYALPLVLFN